MTHTLSKSESKIETASTCSLNPQMFLTARAGQIQPGARSSPGSPTLVGGAHFNPNLLAPQDTLEKTKLEAEQLRI